MGWDGTGVVFFFSGAGIGLAVQRESERALVLREAETKMGGMGAFPFL
jgi:hypothetical protein